MRPSLDIQLKNSMQLSQKMHQALFVLSLSCKDLEEYVGIAHNFIEDTRAAKRSVFEDIRDVFSSKEEEKMGEILFLHFDKNGFCKEPLESIAEQFSFHFEDLKKALKKIQEAFKNGIGAFCFQEAFLIQLDRDSLAYEIISEHYDDFLHQRHETLAKKLNESVDTIKLIIKEDIATLQIPLIEQDTNEAPVVFFDILLFYEDQWIIEINSPDIDENHPFYPFCEKRKAILYDITNYLLVHISDYLLGKTPYLPPLLLKDLAKVLKISESSMTRAISNKYLYCPVGTILLRDLFSLPIQEGLSTQKAKAVLLELLKTKSTLSDAKLSDLLKEQGIQIERRTVAKYRKELGILPKRMRK
ncbi:MAG: hypothetical protein FJZ56_00410 [Chlamydiae bacterium]|nr:hypothetical protein [Chlamydiota bacterium]